MNESKSIQENSEKIRLGIEKILSGFQIILHQSRRYLTTHDRKFYFDLNTEDNTIFVYRVLDWDKNQFALVYRLSYDVLSYATVTDCVWRAYFPEFPGRSLYQWAEKHSYRPRYVDNGYESEKLPVRYLRDSDEKFFQNVLKLLEKNEELLALRVSDIDNGVVPVYNAPNSQMLVEDERIDSEDFS